MAFTTTITKTSMHKLNAEDFSVSFNVAIHDDKGIVFLEKDYSERWWSQTPMSIIEEKLQNKIKADWGDRVVERERLEEIQVDTTISNMKAVIDVFVNKTKEIDKV